MENLTVRAIDIRVLQRLRWVSSSLGRSRSELGRDILSRAVGVEPKSDLPSSIKGASTPPKLEHLEYLVVPKRALTVRDVSQRVMGKIRAAAKRNGRTVSAEARSILTENVGYDPPLSKKDAKAHADLSRALGHRYHAPLPPAQHRKSNGQAAWR